LKVYICDADASSDSLAASTGIHSIKGKKTWYKGIGTPKNAKELLALQFEKSNIKPTMKSELRFLQLANDKLALEKKLTLLWQKRGITWKP